MASSTKIQKFWVSFIWFETKFSFLKMPVPDTETLPFSFLGRNYLYEEKFNEIANNTPQITTLSVGDDKIELTLPWKSNNTAQDFWFHYLGQVKKNVIARLAWERFVPLRGKWIYTLQATSDWTVQPEHVDLEVFYYPHGIGLVTTFRCQLPEDGELADMLDLAFQIRRDGKFDLAHESQDDKKTGPFSLDAVAGKALDFLRNQAWADLFPGQPSLYVGYPFSIFTVTRGQQADNPTPSREDILHSLYAVSEWKTLPPDQSPPTDNAILPGLKKASSNDILYGPGISGRAVWLPGTFLQPYGEKILVSYHRNLVLASLQVASLCGLVYESSKILQNLGSPPLSPYQSDCLRRAVQHLEQLYIGNNSYGSYSVRRQIEQNKDVLDAINYVKAYWNMDPLPTLQALHPTQPASPTPQPATPAPTELEKVPASG